MEERKGIKWDEEGIQEHDKTRGTRTKITEPKTPYNYYNEDEDPDLLEQVEEAIPKLEKLKKKQEFEEKRKHHYNEFEMMRQFKQQHNDDDEEDEN